MKSPGLPWLGEASDEVPEVRYDQTKRKYSALLVISSFLQTSFEILVKKCLIMLLIFGFYIKQI
jgi:hypothetical protein